MVTTATADNALKSYYLGVVSDQLNFAVNPLLARIRQTTSDVWGKDVRKLVRVGVNGGVGAGTEDGELPSAGGNRYAQFVATLKNLYGTIEISDKAIRASANNEGAFVSLLNDEMDGLVKSSAFHHGLERQRLHLYDGRRQRHRGRDDRRRVQHFRHRGRERARGHLGRPRLQEGRPFG